MAAESNMKISVSNYGPIAEAKDIELCPLTVFVGPSNTGKSYLAILIYALFRAFEAEFSSSKRRFYYGKSLQHSLFPDIESMNEEIDHLLEKETDIIQLSDFSESLKKYVNTKIAARVNGSFFRELSRCMATPQDEVHLMDSEFNLSVESFKKVLVLRKNTPDMDIKKLAFSRYELIEREIAHRKITSKAKVEEETFIDYVTGKIFSDSAVDSFYLPAARTGIMQSHKAIIGALVDRAASVDIEDLPAPTMSGIVSNFLKEIISMDAGKASAPGMREVADEIERKILHGSIKLVSGEANQYPKFLYKQNGLEIPLLRSSSMVSELAPVVLFIKHKVGKNDLLIIEEPEAHLHPEAQRGIAKIIVQLVRSGTRVIITTHSDYFVEQLENHIWSATLTESQRKKLFGSADLFLDESEVGAYSFYQHKDEKTIVNRLVFDQESGLFPEGHNIVSSDLYNETATILDKIEEQKYELKVKR